MYVGIDVSKEKFDACRIGDEGKKLFFLSCPTNREGFDKLMLQLTARSTASLLLGLESTASYHIALFSYLTAKGYRVAIINPLLMQTSKALPEKNEDRQEGRLYHRSVLALAEGGHDNANHVSSRYGAERSFPEKGEAR